MFFKGPNIDASRIKRPAWIHFYNITAGDRNKVANNDYRDTGWHTDGNKIGASIVFQYQIPVDIIQVAFYFTDPANPVTNAVYRIDGSFDGNVWESASEWFHPSEAISTITYKSIGARLFWRAIVVSSIAADSKDTGGSWFSELEMFENKAEQSPQLEIQPQTYETSILPAQTSITNMKIGGIPIVYAGGGLLGLLVLLKLFRR